jgi:hypothetical protein
LGAAYLHVHFHTLAVDAVFGKHEGGVRVHEAPPPEKADLDELVRRVHARALVWLRRHHYLDERPAEEHGNDAREQEPLDAFAALALAGGKFVGRPFEPKPAQEASFDNKERRFSASYEGFDVHCAVRIAKDDDEGRERLVRYCARPPFALERIERVLDGRIAYRMKTPRRGSTHRVMTPVEFMARLAILVPPPYFPLTRYHGVFAARSSWRPLVTLKPPGGAARPKSRKPCEDREPPAPGDKPPRLRSGETTAPRPEPRPTAKPTAPSPALLVAATRDDPAVITVKHWGRLLEGALYAASSRLDWAVLMKRTHGLDVLVCPRCQATMRPIATITEPAAIRDILVHLGVRAEPLPRARARDPTGQESFDFDAA